MNKNHKIYLNQDISKIILVYAKNVKNKTKSDRIVNIVINNNVLINHESDGFNYGSRTDVNFS